MTFACIRTVVWLFENETERKCICVSLCVCVRASVRVCVFWKGVRACVFLHNNGGKTFVFHRSKLKLERFNFKGPQADKKAVDL